MPNKHPHNAEHAAKQRAQHTDQCSRRLRFELWHYRGVDNVEHIVLGDIGEHNRFGLRLDQLRVHLINI